MKTKAIVFGSSHTIRLFKSLNIPIIAINNLGEQVQFMGEVVSLVVVLHRSLSWEPQVNHTSKKSNRALFGLKFIRSYFTLLLMYRIVRMKEPPIPINLIDRTVGLERTSTLPNYHQKNFRLGTQNCETLSRKTRVTCLITRALRVKFVNNRTTVTDSQLPDYYHFS